MEVRNVHKFFGGTCALNDVDLTVARGSVHALVGENGAGKSTLGKIIAGVHTPDRGEIRVDGEVVNYRSPSGAIRDGIVVIEQELSLAPDLTVAENIFLGAESSWFGITSRRALRRRFEELVADIGFDLPRDAAVGSLRLAKQQEVTLVWAIARKARLIVMDEPTAALAQPEAAKLRSVVRRLSASGVAIVFISHFLEEVLEIADTITVMRNGRQVDNMAASEGSIDRLIVGMLGQGVEATFPPKPALSPDAAVTLRVRDLSQPGTLESISFDAQAGEIIGVFGLVGSGRSELAHALVGAGTRVTGTVSVDGNTLPHRGIRSAMRAGVTLLPESRKDQGLFLNLSQLANTSAASLTRYARWTRSGAQRERRACTEMLSSLRVEPLLLDSPVSALSGGNQQKLLFGKCLMNEPQVLVLDEPTRGVDIGAKLAIYKFIADLAERGRTVVMISSELEEVTQLCHRVLVMRDGRIVADRPGDFKQHEAILSAAFGYDAVGNATDDMPQGQGAHE